MPQKIADLDSILHHLGIDPSENSLDIISQLMNRTLQCLGSIRLLFEQLEKERISKYTTVINEANLYKKKEQEYWAIKKAFAFANDRMIHEIMRSEEIHNLNPARHIIESFPCEESYGKKEWLAAHWTVLGKNNYDHPEHDEQEDISISTRTTTTTDSMEVVSSQLVTPVDEQIVVLDQLADIYPSSFKEVDKEKRSILHIAARLDSIPLFDAVLKNCKRTKGITVKDSNLNGALPLHNAARFSKSSSLFLHVEDEYKEALIMKNKEGMLPLHWAAAKNRSVEIVKHLIDTYPECIRIPNDEGYLPLHLAGQNDCLEVVQAIYDAYPDAISIHDHDGGLPIHHACSITKNLDVVKFLYEKYPPAITQSQEHGITPLHLAASQNDCPALFHFIIDKAPESLYIRDAVGCLPIDCLIMRIKYGVTPQLLECLRIFFQHSKKIVQQSIEQGDHHPSTPAAVHTIMNDLGVELLLRKDYLTRLFLSSLSPLQLTAVTSPDSTLTYQHLLTTLLRTARKNAILLFVQLSRQLTIPPTMTNDHNQFLWEKYIHQYFLNKPTAMETVQDANKISLWVEKASRLRKEQSIVLTKLCQRFMSPESIEIPTGILRIVIKFL